MPSDLSASISTLSETLAQIQDDVENDIETLLNLPCEAIIEDIETETGEVTVDVHLDLATLRKRLKERGDYREIELGIEDNFTVRIWPTED